eukprot:Gb_11934 [translate_table: standard]
MKMNNLFFLSRNPLDSMPCKIGIPALLSVIGVPLGNLSSLERLDLSSNFLGGHIPPQLGRLSRLRELSLESENSLRGTIPSSLGLLSRLRELLLDNNHLEGTIPSSLSNCQNLVKLSLWINRLTGLVPPQLGQLTKLWSLDLGGNELSGTIPSSLSNISTLTYLYFDSNHLSGNIPASLGKSWRLEWLDLSNNKLRGKIPPEVTGLQNLIHFNLSVNMLEGRLPPEVGKMIHVQRSTLRRDFYKSYGYIFYGKSSSLQPANYAKLLFFLFLTNFFFIDEGPRIYVKHSKWRLILGISLGVAFLSITAVMLITIHLLRKSERNNLDLRVYMDSIDSRPASVENFLQGYAGGPSRYSYRQIRKYTNNFRDKLGQGGFGQVFKGKLPNGSLVAVKLLDQSRQSEQQFLNEVATIGRIHHLHLVRLLGYCFQKSKSALVYEYMINGSLEKYIHGSQDTHPDHVLDWKQLYSIAIGTARGIAYLHEDCANRILHCDIKPHNVLLDANYSPRVADFGLAKLRKREESHMSITTARGTPGYAAPRDVMVGGRKNMDVGGSRSSQIYFTEWAFKQAEKSEFGNRRMRSEAHVSGMNVEVLEAEDENIAKKITLIGLSCIHYDSSHRPSMVKVIQMLEESVQVTIPSFPFPPAYVPARPASISSESSSYSS